MCLSVHAFDGERVHIVFQHNESFSPNSGEKTTLLEVA